jgi:hypothetical protein
MAFKGLNAFIHKVRHKYFLREIIVFEILN